jgi:predicted helicase
MSIQAINEYHNNVHKIFLFSRVNHEQAIKNEFAILINSYCKDKNLLLIQEKTIKNQQGKNIRPDGTLSNILIDLGFWESKANVDLDKEITNKRNAGYPLDNTLFQDDQKAVLFQNGERCFETPLDNKEDLDKLLTQFVSFKSKDVKEFYDAVENFKYSLPDILETINKEITLAETNNPQFKKARLSFLNICEKSINPSISINDINEMLLQHILTEEIFNSIFDNADFHRDNNIAKELYKLEETFFKGKTKKDTLSKVQTYYAAIKRRAASIIDHHEKQAFLKAFYEDFYKIYNPKAADRMGIVYTPNEIVKFQIESVDYLLEKHFKKTLAHEGIKILDPCVGTGTYICELIDYLPPKDLEKKFNQDIFCNELGLLPYYIANLNIEYTYQQKIGEYAEFNNLCWVDTLDNTGFHFKGSNTELFGLSVENTARIKTQNEQQISVIIGNPPYNAKQENYNQQNANRLYKIIDEKIKTTYIKNGTAQNQIVLYDMYTRFYRWATDRIDNEQGIISFITNNSFINAKTFDGFRKCISQDFDFAYIIDTKSDVRANPKIAGTTHNVFGIQTGVALMFLVKKKTENKKPCKIFYISLQDEILKSEKLKWLSDNKIENIEFDLIIPNDKNDWINQTDNDFDSLIPICDKEVKLGNSNEAIFKLFSRGVETNRDEWLYDFNIENLKYKVTFFINIYNKSVINQKLDLSIKWESSLKTHMNSKKLITFKNELIIKSIYRPFTKLFYYSGKEINHRLTQNHYDMFGENLDKNNKVICFPGIASPKNFHCIGINGLIDLNALPAGCQNLPFYIYDKEGNPQENITNWALELFQNHYNNQEITKEQIFNYVYAVLHDPKYRQKYEQNLKREFPRIPFYDNFEQWAKLGKELIDLHLNYETVEKYPLQRIDSDNAKIPKAKLKADKANGIIQLDDNTRLENVPCEAWEYLLGNRSALEWVLDQYKEKTPKDATIAQNFNTYRFADHKEHVIDLLCRVCKVSVETVRIVQALHNLSPINDP